MVWRAVAPSGILGYFLVGQERAFLAILLIALLTSFVCVHQHVAAATDQGPLLALPVVFFPDTPALQVFCCQCILISYVALQLLSWPWKAPILNIVDFATCFLLAVLVMVTGFTCQQ